MNNGKKAVYLKGKQIIYLDNASTTKVRQKTANIMASVMTKDYGNPSSLHGFGLNAERQMVTAKEKIADLLNVSAGELTAVSGGTEANNLAIFGAAKSRTKHMITSSGEHPSVLNTALYLEKNGWSVTYLNLDTNGEVNPDDLKDALRQDTAIVSIMHVNNETGAINKILDLGRIIKAYNNKIIFHVDGVQAYGKISINLKDADIDLYSISAHKVHGPKGVGMLYIKKGVIITPRAFGGGQEKTFRSGTENIPGIVGFGHAAVFMAENHKKRNCYLNSLKNKLSMSLLNAVPDVKINGDINRTAPHILNVSFPGIRGEVLLHALESDGIYISTGAACSSKKTKESHVLRAMGVDKRHTQGAVRFSFSEFNTIEEIDETIKKIEVNVKMLSLISRKR